MMRRTTLFCLWTALSFTHLAAAQTPQAARRTPLVAVVDTLDFAL